MLAYPNAKINLGLQILDKRTDGYHTIASLLYPVGWSDALEIMESDKLSLSISGRQIDAGWEDNLVIKAYRLVAASYPLPPLQIHLHKNTPFGAGLGGGSSDAAFMLKILNEKFNLGITEEELEAYASQIGSDCPFFIKNQPAIASGRGEILQPFTIDMSWKYLVVVFPNVLISSKEAYSGVKPRDPEKRLEDILRDPSKWREELVNDFEHSVFSRYPIIESVKKSLYDAGAGYASLSGSGSAVFGFFHHRPATKKWVEKGYAIWEGPAEHKPN